MKLEKILLVAIPLTIAATIIYKVVKENTYDDRFVNRYCNFDRLRELGL